MSQAWSHVFLNLHHNSSQTKGRQGWMVDQIWTFSKIILKNSTYLYFIHIENFFAEVYWVIYRIRWKNKNVDVMGTLKVSRKGVWRVCRQKNVTLRMNFWTTLLQWHINCSTVHEFCSVCCQHLLRLIHTYNFQLLVCVSFQFLFQFYWF